MHMYIFLCISLAHNSSICRPCQSSKPSMVCTWWCRTRWDEEGLDPDQPLLRVGLANRRRDTPYEGESTASDQFQSPVMPSCSQTTMHAQEGWHRALSTDCIVEATCYNPCSDGKVGCRTYSITY